MMNTRGSGYASMKSAYCSLSRKGGRDCRQAVLPARSRWRIIAPSQDALKQIIRGFVGLGIVLDGHRLSCMEREACPAGQSQERAH